MEADKALQDESNFPMLPKGLILISGPSRGGKSRWAEQLISTQNHVTYVATSSLRPNDLAWETRLRKHRERRPSHWLLVEPGENLSKAIRDEKMNQTLLIDSLGGFTAALLELTDLDWEKKSEELIQSLLSRQSPTLMVVEETGWGVVPATAVGGLFRDRQGLLAQRLEQQATQSWLVLQGRALNLTQLGILVP